MIQLGTKVKKKMLEGGKKSLKNEKMLVPWNPTSLVFIGGTPQSSSQSRFMDPKQSGRQTVLDARDASGRDLGPGPAPLLRS